MVLKRIVILTKSKKYNNFCVAGLDVGTGEWVRVVTDDMNISHAVIQQDMRFSNGEEADILDVIEIDFLRHTPLCHQPENWTMNRSVPWSKIRTMTLNEVLGLRPAETNGFIFYNSEKFVSQNALEEIRDEDKYSLTLIAPVNPKIIVGSFKNKKKVSACFGFNGENYAFLQITDHHYLSKYSKKLDGTYYDLENSYFVVSVTDFYDAADKTKAGYYKVIAKIFNS